MTQPRHWSKQTITTSGTRARSRIVSREKVKKTFSKKFLGKYVRPQRKLLRDPKLCRNPDFENWEYSSFQWVAITF